jgi:hypothetical protein
MTTLEIIGIILIVAYSFLLVGFGISYEIKEKKHYKRLKERRKEAEESIRERRRRSYAAFIQMIESEKFQFPNHDKEFIEELKNFKQ